MKRSTLDILRSPISHEPLQFSSNHDVGHEFLVTQASGDRFPVRDGIPVFLGSESLSGNNAKYQKLYDRFAGLYDISTRVYAIFKGGGEKVRLMEYLSELEIQEGQKVLEVSIGTGRNIRFLPRAAQYFGIDISWGMLQRCKRSAAHEGMDVELFCASAEALPFKDNVFDVVYHIGGINYFNDRKQALGEMTRVAKPGTKMIVVDETEELARQYERTPIAKYFYQGRKEKITAPVDLLPRGMKEVNNRTVANGDLFLLSFRKPV